MGQRARIGSVVRCLFGVLWLQRLRAIFVPDPDDTPQPSYCTVYNHLVKSGGTSIKEQLVRSGRGEHFRQPGLCTSDGSTVIEDCYEALRNASVIMGYGELLRNALRDEGRECQWFTMMRHPIDQLISAFYYCPEHDVQRRPREMCADAQGQDGSLTARLVEFAENHWVNMIYRQMLHSIFCQPKFELCPPQLARPRSSRPFNLNTKESRETLFKIQKILLSYTAVGLYSQWEVSMELFDATINSPVRKWDHRVVHNIGLQSPERDALSKWAFLSPEIRSILSADLLLYNFGERIFRNQTRVVLGKQWEYGSISSTRSQHETTRIIGELR